MGKRPGIKLFQLRNEKIGGSMVRIDFCNPRPRSAHATCEKLEDPKSKSRIMIDPSLLREGNEKQLLNVVIHECTHAAFFWMDEDHVTSFARDLSRVLWKFGYRLEADVLE